MSKNNTDLFVRTPLIESLELSQFCNNKVYLKLESCQPSASFKMRGVGRLCQQGALEGRDQIISSSGGNAGLATACAARMLGLECRVFVPKTTSSVTREKIAREGAEVVIAGEVWNEANEMALKAVQQSPNCLYVHPFDNPILWSGHSTMIDEIAEDLDVKPSMIVTCCGGGGLLCGIIEGMRRHGWTSVPVLAMETIGADSLNAAVIASNGGTVRPVRIPAITSIAKSLGSLIICDQLAADCTTAAPPVLSHLCTDRDAVDACIKFADQHRILVELACGASLSALYTGLVKRLFLENSDQYSDGPVVVIICGGASVTIDMINEWKTQFNL
ncbi:unnamed protein product [Medioppia subpectinata]|uniref:L-serine ammonia-lyase n=1 Tax=Medioppia subpectinata TaxID=1979941 RepID=A0A7R9Q050_9ACAR|nr:unnamed protein product [Medioppia subpectinata]CAG2107719.1 unnamed protein product [Medioppia subpectinata]